MTIVACSGKENYLCSTLYEELKPIAQVLARECILHTDYYSDFSVQYYYFNKYDVLHCSRTS